MILLRSQPPVCVKFVLKNLTRWLNFQNVVLQEGTASFNAWVSPPAPIFIEFYFFNLTNPEAVLGEHAKPNLQQIGPYTYK